MGDSIYFGNKTPRAPHLVTPGGLSGEVLDLRNDVDEGFVDIEAALGNTLEPPTHARYVDINASSGGNGTQSKPYTAIQEAVDDLELLTLDTTKESAVVYIQPGKYEEAVVIHKPSITLMSRIFTAHGSMRTSVWIDPPANQWPLTVTNATPESLAAYNVSGDYGDLVNQGDSGPKYNRFIGLYFFRSSDDAGLVRLLGVKGDYSPSQTEFGFGILFEHSRLSHNGAYPYGLHAKNCGEVIFVYSDCVRGKHRIENCYREYHYNSAAPDIHMTYDDTDPHGTHRYGYLNTLFLESSTLSGENDDSLIAQAGGSGGAYLTVLNSHIGYRTFSTANTITVEGSNGRARFQASNSLMNLSLQGDIDLLANDFRITGDVELQSGPGTADWEGVGGWAGELTDPDNKLVQNPYKKIAYPAIATSAITATPSQRIRYNASGGTFQIDAPASPVTGDSFGVKEIAGDATNITVSGNGNNIEHPVTGVVAASAVFGVARIGVTWEFDGTDWIVI